MKMRSEVIQNAVKVLNKLQQNNKKVPQSEWNAAESHLADLEHHLQIMQKLDHLRQSTIGARYYTEIVKSAGDKDKVSHNFI